jgi:asparagine synthase (glutamine-hydrolysing)
MRDTLLHRGPDAAGAYLDGPAGLGHRRLSIVDVAHGHQPMSTDDGALTIVYNGEVYNHGEIRDSLQSRGVRFRTRSDTEAVLRLYAAEGAASVERLRGMFAFAIWDRRTRELFLARDRLGIKPLYYHLADDGSLAFGSEIKAVLAAPGVRAELNHAALPDYLANHAPSGTDTLFAAVRRLAPGHTLRWRDGQLTIRRYWDVHYPSEMDARSDTDLIEEFSRLLEESVRLRLMADVPLGAFLSGGIDSAAITAVMARLVDTPVNTFSVAFAEREANEFEYARTVARAFRTEHHEVIISPEQFFGAIPALVEHEDEPMAHPSSVPLHFVSKLAAEHVKVVLTGEGSDELLAGYGRYWKTVQNLSLGARYERWVPSPLRAQVRRAIEARTATSQTAQRLARTFLVQPVGIESLYFDNFAVFSRARQRALLTPEACERIGAADPYAAMRAAIEGADADTLLNRLLYADLKTYLHELLMKQDQMSMSASIESRVPFLDHRLVEFASALPERLKLRGALTKYILREAMKDLLPEPILTRGKMGFPVPFGAWVRGSHRGWLEEMLLGERALARGLFDADYVRRLARQHVAGEANHSERLWALANFEVWQRRFLDGELSAPASITPRPVRVSL